jgi:hypothetical protein
MNLPRPFLNRPNPLRPALDFLTSSFQSPTKSSSSVPPSSLALDFDFDPDDTLTSLSSPSRHTTRSSASHSRTSSGADLDLPPTPGIPLIDFSRTPSPPSTPYRGTSVTASEDEGGGEDVRPLVRERRTAWRREGGVGAFLFGSWTGWQVYVGVLAAWWVASGLVLAWMNRVILWCEFYP